MCPFDLIVENGVYAYVVEEEATPGAAGAYCESATESTAEGESSVVVAFMQPEVKM